MIAGIRKWSSELFERALERNVETVGRLLASAPPGAAFLDLGCDDGSLTARLAAAIDTADVHGLELVEERARLAAQRGVEVRIGDLNAPFPYPDSTFDVVCSHQVIEHVVELDRFVAELFRVTRPGGFAITSTENLASWHNIAALVLGWQPFSLGNITQTGFGLGNPLAVHRDEHDARESWRHVHVLSHRGLRELFLRHGFEVEEMVGCGYYPLPARVGGWEPRHAAFLTMKTRRPG